VIENGVVQDLLIERVRHQGFVNNIYKGQVARVLPGMQAAFVDIGLERAGFLHVSDIMPLREDGALPDFNSPAADINKWLKEGQKIFVQVQKDPLGNKGARLSMHLSIASRYLVHMPDLNHIGVSVRLGNLEERERLQKILSQVLATDQPQGFIIRTVAEGATEEMLRQDVDFLKRLWANIMHVAEKAPNCSMVYEDLPLTKRVLRDLVTAQVESIRVDSREAFDEMTAFSKLYSPDVLQRLSLYQGATPIFESYSVEEEFQKALKRKVPLKSGGYLVIDETEAMTTVDVNTGAFVGQRNLEETIFKTNLEAVQAIARQMRLRNCGGMIIIDFIDMMQKDHRDQVYAALCKALEKDYAKTSISEISALGLVQMTRKRTQESLMQQLCEPCAHCEGLGKVKTLETMTYEIMREVLRESHLYEGAEKFLVIAAPDVVKYLVEEESQYLADMEQAIRRPIQLQSEAVYVREQYDIILM
jgi:ribonuclease G